MIGSLITCYPSLGEGFISMPMYREDATIIAMQGRFHVGDVRCVSALSLFNYSWPSQHFCHYSMFVTFCIQIMCFSFLFCLLFAFRSLPVISVQRMLIFTRICSEFMVYVPTSVLSVQNSEFSMSVLSITPSDMFCNWSAEYVCLCMQQSTHIVVPLPLNF